MSSTVSAEDQFIIRPKKMKSNQFNLANRSDKMAAPIGQLWMSTSHEKILIFHEIVSSVPKYIWRVSGHTRICQGARVGLWAGNYASLQYIILTISRFWHWGSKLHIIAGICADPSRANHHIDSIITWQWCMSIQANRTDTTLQLEGNLTVNVRYWVRRVQPNCSVSWNKQRMSQ